MAKVKIVMLKLGLLRTRNQSVVCWRLVADCHNIQQWFSSSDEQDSW